MPSSVVIITSIASLLGFAINVAVMLFILVKGREKHHILFALLLSIAAFWDLGIFLVMIRNDFPDEILTYQKIISIPFNMFPALIYHFTTTYLNQPRKKSTIAIYAYCLVALVLSIIGAAQTYTGIYDYSWGKIAKWSPVYHPALGFITGFGPDPSIIWLLLYFFSLFFSCLLLLQARRKETSPVARRHLSYILVSFIVFGVAYVKVLLTYGIDVPFLLPLGILLVDSFGAIIGFAIVKDRLFDLTFYLKKGIFYSLFAALIVFIFDYSQHLVATYLGGMLGEESVYAHYVSIAIIIIVFMPIKQRLEHIVERLFSEKKIEF